METSLRVLHVEADWEVRAIVEMSLRLDSAFLVSGSATATEALEVLAGETPLPNILLLDSGIAGMSGIDLLKTIRSDPRWSELPVAFLTGRVMTREVATMLEAGAVGVLTKPFNPLTLAQEVRALLRH